MTEQRLKSSLATLTDTPAITALVNSAYRGESSKKGWTTEADLLDGLRTNEDELSKIIQKSGSVILKCTNQEDTLLGCVYLEIKNESLYLGMLTVSPEKQAAGIGKYLLGEAEQYARENHCRFITMTVISIRKELIAWYERRGYLATGELLPFPKDPVFGHPRQELFFIVMKKQIPPAQRN